MPECGFILKQKPKQNRNLLGLLIAVFFSASFTGQPGGELKRKKESMMVYIGTYHDRNGEIRLDINSMATKAHVAIHKLYEDMTEVGITDGSNAAQPSDQQLDELNQSECDIIMLDDEDIDGLKQRLKLI